MIIRKSEATCIEARQNDYKKKEGVTMEKIKIRKIYGLMALGAFLWLLPSVGLGQCNASIVGGRSSYASIIAAVSAAVPNDTINVSGTCNELVFIFPHKNSITLNGGGTATITCQNPIPAAVCTAQNNVMILGKLITITGFNITGGQAGIAVAANGAATIAGNTIYNTKRNGIGLILNGIATIVNNTIHDTGLDPDLTQRAGIYAGDNASAFIGYSNPNETAPSPNIIQNNANGILLVGSASARIVGNTISDNTENGVMVIQGSHAQIAGNVIDGNGQDGIFVRQGSGVYLGLTANTILDQPNSGTNHHKGLSCSIGGYVDGL